MKTRKLTAFYKRIWRKQMGNERTELALAEERESASAPMEMIHKAFEAAIANGSGLEVVDRILSHQREMMDYQDRERFQAALRRIQDELKPIVKDAENPETHSKYASAEAVDNAIQGLLERERMTLSFEPESHPSPEMVRIVGVLSLGAYSKRYPLDMPADGKGAKGGGVMSRTHATGSAITYGKRYLKNMIFDLRLREKKMGLDDDGNKLPPSTLVTVLHHLGLEDESIVQLPAGELVSFSDVDHLTSLWIDGLRTTGEAMDDLVAFMRRLRLECPWDQEQTHASLTRHLLEEAYETLDALEAFVRVEDAERDEAAAHVEEELGDLLFQIVFHAELGDEEDLFTLATIADGVRDKLTGRHPHVFGDTQVKDSNEVAARWEILKRDEKGRESVTDGIAWQLPALILYTKLLRKAALVEPRHDGENSRARALDALRAVSLDHAIVEDAQSSSDVDATWGDAVVALVEMAQWAGVDLEGVLRERAIQLRDAIRIAEASARVISES